MMGSTFVYNSGEATVAKDELHPSFGLFFDGTLNNKENTRIREAVENNTAKAWEKKVYKMHGGDSSDNTSYQNDYSNVARMQMGCKGNYAIYIEGIGTIGVPTDIESLEPQKQKQVIRGLGDVTEGYSMGSGFTGIRGKVRIACEALIERIKETKKIDDNKTKQFKSLTLDVFGFSRGAAAARNFVYEVNSQSKRPQDVAIKKSTKTVNYIAYGGGLPIPVQEDVLIDKDKKEIEAAFLDNGTMPQCGYLGYLLLKNKLISKEQLKRFTIIIRFIGVYDTVSSYEEANDSTLKVYRKLGWHLISNQFQNDVEQLQLNNLGSFQKAVHFTAMDEHRENFDLTRMPLAIERNLPGVHCDVGGAYNTGTETVSEIENSSYEPFALKKRMEQLIEEYWYSRDQIKIIKNYNVLTGTRFLYKEYSYIPLHFMETMFKELLANDVNEVFAQNMVDKYPLKTKNIAKQKNTPLSYINTNLFHNWPKQLGINLLAEMTDDEILKHAKDYLSKHVFEKGPEWQFISDEDLKKRKEKEEFRKQLENNVLETHPKPANNHSEDEIGTVSLEEIEIKGYNNQAILRALRNKYLHWSANRAGLGMDPRDNYKRVEH